MAVKKTAPPLEEVGVRHFKTAEREGRGDGGITHVTPLPGETEQGKGQARGTGAAIQSINGTYCGPCQ